MPAKPLPVLIVTKRGQEAGHHAIEARETAIGRHRSNDVVLKGPSISRQHAKVIRRDQAYYYLDLASRIGSYLDGKKIRGEHLLASGDRIEIGEFTLVFFSDRDSDDAMVSSLTGELGPDRPTPTPIRPDWKTIQTLLPHSGGTDEGVRRLQALYEISLGLNANRSLDEVLASIMDKAIAIMGAERGFLMLADPDSGDLDVAVARDLNGDLPADAVTTTSRKLMNTVMQTGRPVLIGDAQTEEWGTKSAVHHGIHSALCTPLISRDAVTGVIYVDHKTHVRAFTSQDLAFFTTFALQAKAAIESSQAYLELVESLFRASGDFIVLCSVDGRITRANRSAQTLVGRDESELAGRRVSDLVVAADRESAADLTQRTVDLGLVSDREMTINLEGGRQVPLSVSSFALRDRSGKVTGMCLIGRDQSEIKSLINQLTAANDTLELHNRFIRKTFGRYLSDEIVERLLESPSGLRIGGEKRTVTILMSDLRGFSTLCERLPAERVVEMLNYYLEAMVEVIAKHHGTIDEILGDAILVIFGAPEKREDDACRAAACAVEMQLEMSGVNQWNRANQLPDLAMGIALHTGGVVVGNIGSERRTKYAVVGSPINLTARIESHAAAGEILISSQARLAGGEILRTGGSREVEAKGFENRVEVHELLGVAAPYDLYLAGPKP